MTGPATGQIVDLSVLLDEELPCTWPGHVPFMHKVHNWFRREPGSIQPLRSGGPYFTCMVVIDEHAGTHFDAPAHFIPPPQSGIEHAGEPGLEYGHAIPLADLQGPAAVVDVRPLTAASNTPGTSPRITVTHLQEWEKTYGDLRPGEIVLLMTGWDRYYLRTPDGSRYLHDPIARGTAPGWPVPDADAVKWLHDRGVLTIGTDAPSIGGVDDGISMHRAGLQAGMRYVEGLTGLTQLPIRGAYFVFAPLKIAGSSGGPGRAFAYLSQASA